MREFEPILGSSKVNTPSGRQSMPVFVQPHQLDSYRAYEENGDGKYANQTIPFEKKVAGGEAAYEQAIMKKSTS